jgi:hypothetical protein
MYALKRVLAVFVLAGIVFAFSAESSTAQSPMLGFRTGAYADEREAFVGGEFLARLFPRLYFNPNVEYVLIDNGTFSTFNFDFHYDFPLRGRTFTWAGAGLGIQYFNPEGPVGSSTDPAANFLFGLGYNAGGWVPYIQAKVIAGDNSDFVFGGGIRFALE